MKGHGTLTLCHTQAHTNATASGNDQGESSRNYSIFCNSLCFITTQQPALAQGFKSLGSLNRKVQRHLTHQRPLTSIEKHSSHLLFSHPLVPPSSVVLHSSTLLFFIHPLRCSSYILSFFIHPPFFVYPLVLHSPPILHSSAALHSSVRSSFICLFFTHLSFFIHLRVLHSSTRSSFILSFFIHPLILRSFFVHLPFFIHPLVLHSSTRSSFIRLFFIHPLFFIYQLYFIHLPFYFT